MAATTQYFHFIVRLSQTRTGNEAVPTDRSLSSKLE